MTVLVACEQTEAQKAWVAGPKSHTFMTPSRKLNAGTLAPEPCLNQCCGHRCRTFPSDSFPDLGASALPCQPGGSRNLAGPPGRLVFLATPDKRGRGAGQPFWEADSFPCNLLILIWISMQRNGGSGKDRQISYDITYTWSLKYDTNELIYKTEIDSQA